MNKDIKKDENIISVKDVDSFYNSIKSWDWKTEMIQDWGPTTGEGIISINELAHKVEELKSAVEDLESRLDILLKNNSKTNCSNPPEATTSYSNSLEEIEKCIKKLQMF